MQDDGLDPPRVRESGWAAALRHLRRPRTLPLLRATVAAVLCGALLGRLAPPGVAWSAFAALAVILGGTLARSRRRRADSAQPDATTPPLTAACVPTCVLAAGLLGVARGFPPPFPEVPARCDVAAVEGTVTAAPRPFGPPASDEAPSSGETAFDADLDGVHARVLLRAGAEGEGPEVVEPPPPLPDLLPGDRVRVTGSVRRRSPPRNPGAREPVPGSAPSVDVVCPSPDAVQVLAPGGGPRWLLPRAGELLHRSIVDRLRAACDGDEASAGFLACVLVGERSGVDRETSRAFRDSGTAHLLAVSGLHLVVLVGALAAVGRAVLPTRLRGPLGGPLLTAAVILYVAACRFEVPVLRSAVFLGVASLARLSRRRGSPLDALALAAGLVVAVDPGQLFDPGFQLSFVAVAGLAALTRRFREALFARLDLLARFPEATPAWRLRASAALATGLSASLAASVATAPVVAWHFGTAQPASPLANLLAVPLFGAVLPATAALALAGSAIPWMSGPLAAGATLALGASAAAFSGVSMVCGRPPLSLVGASAGLLLAGAAIRPWRRVHLGFPLAAWGLVALAPGWVRPPPGAEAIALDVGHGVAVLVRADDAALLFDAGGRAPATGDRILVPALRALGVRRLAGLWISHEDSDHLDGALEVLGDVEVGEVVVPEGFGASPLAARLLRACAEASVPVRAVRRGDRMRLRGIDVEVLDPPVPAAAGAENADSLVVRAVAGPVGDAGDGVVAVLLPGDVEGERLATLAEDATLPRADVLLLPHHGRGDVGPQEALARRTGASVLVASTSEAVPTSVPGAWITGVRGAVRVRPGRAPEGWPW